MLECTVEFEKLLREHYAAVNRYAKSLCRCEYEASDLTQEAFLRAYKSYSRFDHRSSFEAWVKTIVRNQYYDLLRKRRRRRKGVSAYPSATAKTAAPMGDAASPRVSAGLPAASAAACPPASATRFTRSLMPCWRALTSSAARMFTLPMR